MVTDVVKSAVLTKSSFTFFRLHACLSPENILSQTDSRSRSNLGDVSHLRPPQCSAYMSQPKPSVEAYFRFESQVRLAARGSDSPCLRFGSVENGVACGFKVFVQEDRVRVRHRIRTGRSTKEKWGEKCLSSEYESAPNSARKKFTGNLTTLHSFPARLVFALH